MKGLKPTTGAILLTLTLPLAANAELRSLNETDMSSVTGQAGLTVEISDAQISIGEINYKDEGNIFIENTGLAGAGLIQARRGLAVTEGNLLDNVKVTVDIAGDASDSAGLESQWGLGKITGAALALSSSSVGDHGESAVDISDGDLVISIGAIDEADMVDFGAYTDRVSLGKSTMNAGEAASNTGTVLMSNVMMSGFVGPIDIVVDGQENTMNINSYLQADGEMTLDFLSTSLDFAVHNRRGQDVLIFDNTATGESVSYFHAQADIGANADPSKGLRFNLTDASGDMDFTNITLGSAPSIGHVYLTDVSMQADLNVYGH
ncbi:DUF6160 family protein [Marinobacteraceae bacterium S3BR75-40.1]